LENKGARNDHAQLDIKKHISKCHATRTKTKGSRTLKLHADFSLGSESSGTVPKPLIICCLLAPSNLPQISGLPSARPQDVSFQYPQYLISLEANHFAVVQASFSVSIFHLEQCKRFRSPPHCPISRDATIYVVCTEGSPGVAPYLLRTLITSPRHKRPKRRLTWKESESRRI
jgi:hypothetical protein